jgi:phage terminase small subunit|tara:strand:+ start:1015 stop:1386 length:372 start_codon:yes stop_codon:yes gene_type:complete
MDLAAESLTDKQKLLVDNMFLPGMTQEQAAVNAGYTKHSAASAASRNLKLPHVQEYMNACVQDAIQSHSIRALAAVVHISEHARGDKTKLEAAQDLLDRAGHKPVEKQQVAIRGEMNVSINLG